MILFDKFSDFMYYLLTSPLKKIEKSRNQWYKLMKVLGKRFDDALESVYMARDQTAVSTCDPEMLQFHAEDRTLTRYAGESDENFRVRIANYTEILKLGGTDDGVLLAVRSLGFKNVEFVPAKEYTGDPSRWAEFFIIIQFGVDDDPDISFEILKKQVRKVKQVGTKDNYLYQWNISLLENRAVELKMVNYMTRFTCFPYMALDGSWKLDGSKKLNAMRKQYQVSSTHHVVIQNEESIGKVICHEEHNLFFLNGSWKLDGSKKLSAWQRTEEL